MKSRIEDWALFGGKRVFDRSRATTNLTVPDEKSFFENIRESFNQNWFSNNGPCVLNLEKKLAAMHGVKFCKVFCNWFSTLYLGLH